MKKLYLVFAVGLLFGYGYVFGGAMVDAWRSMYAPVEVEIVPTPAPGLWTPANGSKKEIHELPEPQMPIIEPGRELNDGPTRNASYAETESDLVSVDGWNITKTEAEIVRYTNEFRVRHGLRPLKVSGRLMGTSRMQAWLQTRSGMRHGYTSGWSAENIAAGQRGPREVVNTWINSSGHRANMLGNWTYIGVGGYSNQWAQQFGR